MTEEWDGVDRRSADRDIAEQLAGLTAAVEDLTRRTELADALNRRQHEINQAVRFQRIAIVLIIASVFAVAIISNRTAVDVADTAARIQCQALNDSNAANAGFWRSTLTQFPTPPPGPDATEEEIADYEAGQERLRLFLESVDHLGEPRAC